MRPQWGGGEIGTGLQKGGNLEKGVKYSGAGFLHKEIFLPPIVTYRDVLMDIMPKIILYESYFLIMSQIRILSIKSYRYNSYIVEKAKI